MERVITIPDKKCENCGGELFLSKFDPKGSTVCFMCRQLYHNFLSWMKRDIDVAKKRLDFLNKMYELEIEDG
ncbi:MAG: hypothetical protein KAS32_19420 [Candidatus Peribacteraceae bacterium]|nr:hypothetical protein [Candidatus Peribacteraceae bacterium]